MHLSIHFYDDRDGHAYASCPIDLEGAVMVKVLPNGRLWLCPMSEYGIQLAGQGQEYPTRTLDEVKAARQAAGWQGED